MFNFLIIGREYSQPTGLVSGCHRYQDQELTTENDKFQ